MKKVYDCYKDNIKSCAIRITALKKRIHLLGTIRLLMLGGWLLLLWLFWGDWSNCLIATALLALPFALLMYYHNRLYIQRLYLEAFSRLNENELKGLDYDYSAFDGAAEKQAADHSFSLDLDLFGEKSLFQSINRTVTEEGRELLAQWLLHPLDNKQAILERQEAVRELTEFTQLRQHFYVTGVENSIARQEGERLSRLMGEQNYFIYSYLWRALIWLVPACWIVIIALCATGMLGWTAAAIFFPFSFLLAYAPTNRINRLYHSVNKMENILLVNSQLIKCIEQHPFRAKQLNELCNQFSNHKKITASAAIKQLSGYIGGLDQRGSFAGILLNLFYLRDVRHALLLERWKSNYAESVPMWREALAQFDAFSSLSTFAFNHPAYPYPEVADTYFEMKGKQLGHPLIPRDQCVKNDVAISDNPSFLIITGANMAGKSTYLRTIGVNMLLALVGAPVCAESFRLYPAHLVTSLRTSDSLVSNESYFFAELKRLKMIIDRIKAGEELFIILDEILKGTNSADKQKGSLALMEQLVNYKSAGIIATHDLLLGTLEETFPQQIKNYRFEADIRDNELSFSYTLREGVARNMNASFLMKKMGITV